MPDDLTALRDRLAGLCGWLHMTAYGVWIHPKMSDDERGVVHPFPPGDLTALFAAIPDTANYNLSRTAEGVYELRAGWPVPYEGVGSSVEAVLLAWLVAALDTSYKMS